MYISKSFEITTYTPGLPCQCANEINITANFFRFVFFIYLTFGLKIKCILSFKFYIK